jgi:hypothetical protein
MSERGKMWDHEVAGGEEVPDEDASEEGDEEEGDLDAKVRDDHSGVERLKLHVSPG